MHKALEHHLLFFKSRLGVCVPSLSSIVADHCVVLALHHDERVVEARSTFMNEVNRSHKVGDRRHSQDRYSFALRHGLPHVTLSLSNFVQIDWSLCGESFKTLRCADKQPLAERCEPSRLVWLEER